MEYRRHTVDVEELFTKILRAALGEIATTFGATDMEVMSQQDVDAIEHVPFVVVNALNGHMLNGPGAWEWMLNVTIVGDSRDSAADIADMVYVAMHESHDNNTRIPGVGAVTSVDDSSMPSRTSTTLTPAGDLTQYDGQFVVVVRKL
jgi:Holliday junction resolvasome RuvABC endonuclease subunit